jgi:hypothetical protein
VIDPLSFSRLARFCIGSEVHLSREIDTMFATNIIILSELCSDLYRHLATTAYSRPGLPSLDKKCDKSSYMNFSGSFFIHGTAV